MAEAYYHAVVMPRDERAGSDARAAAAGDALRRSPLGRRLSGRSRDGWPRPVATDTPSQAGAISTLVRRIAGAKTLSCCSTTTAAWCRSRRFRSWPSLTPRRAQAVRDSCRPSTHTNSHRQRPQTRRHPELVRRPAHLAPRRARALDPPARGARRAVSVDASWKERVLPILLEHAERTPGTFVEEKPAGLAWHYRMADPQYGPARPTSSAST